MTDFNSIVSKSFVRFSFVLCAVILVSNIYMCSVLMLSVYLGFEEGMPVALVVSSCDEPSDQSLASSSVQDEIPVEVGLVRRQTKHIETTYGSGQSPLLSRRHLEADPDTCDLEESSACQHHKPGSCPSKREVTTTLLAPVSGRCPGDVFPGPEKAPVRRDEQRLHLSLSQKGVSPAVQPFESPDRPRHDLFSAPLDLTKKEMSTRKAFFPQREETKGIENIDAKQSEQVPSKGMQPNQEFFKSSGILRRNLSQGNIHLHQPGSDGGGGVSTSAERNYFGFSRAYSFRETTSAVKLDDAALSRFSRSGSLRIERQKRFDERFSMNAPQPLLTQPTSLPKWPLSVKRNVALDAPTINCTATDPTSTAKSGKAGNDFSLAPENRVSVAPVILYNKSTSPATTTQLSKAASDNKEDMLSEKPDSSLNIVNTKCLKGADCKPSVEPDTVAAAVASGTLLMRSVMMMHLLDQKSPKMPNETSSGDLGRRSGEVGPDAKTNSMTQSPVLHKASSSPTDEISHTKNCLSEIANTQPLPSSAVDIETGSSDVISCRSESQRTQSATVDYNALSNEKLIGNSSTTNVSSSVISAQSTHSSKSSVRFSDSPANSGKSKGKAVVNRSTALLDSKQPGEMASTAAETSVTVRTRDSEAGKRDCLTSERSGAGFQVAAERELIKPEKSLLTSVHLPEEKSSHNDVKMLHSKSAACSSAKTLAAHKFVGSFSDTLQIANRPASATEDSVDLVSNDQSILPSSDSVHKQGESDQCHRELAKPQRDLDKLPKPQKELEKDRGELENSQRDSWKRGEDSDNKLQMSERKDVQMMDSTGDLENARTNMLEENDQNIKGAVLLRQNKTVGGLGKSFGCDVHATWSESVSSQPARSQSLHEETCLFASQTTGLHGTKRLYGKSHPLSMLSGTDLSMNNNNWTPSS